MNTRKTFDTKAKPRIGTPCVIKGCKDDVDYFVGRQGTCEAHFDQVVRLFPHRNVRVNSLGTYNGRGRSGSGDAMDRYVRWRFGK